MLVGATAAIADNRTVAYLQGVAFGIAAHCPELPVDDKAIALANDGIEGLLQGNSLDFALGVFQFHHMLTMPSGDGSCHNGGGCTCETVCNYRPGTCYFIKGKSLSGADQRRHDLMR
jgi:hypothetical protein